MQNLFMEMDKKENGEHFSLPKRRAHAKKVNVMFSMGNELHVQAFSLSIFFSLLSPKVKKKKYDS